MGVKGKEKGGRGSGPRESQNGVGYVQGGQGLGQGG